MRVRILRGNQAGMLDEMPERDALAAIADGFAEAYTPPPVVAEPPPKAPTPTPEAPTRRTARPRPKPR